jgi:ABC-type nitrate/sulfonate/bicarbonate transport system substrate-binding protein
MKPTRCRLLLAGLALAAVGLAALTSCSSDSSSDSSSEGQDLKPFTVVLDWTPNTNHAGMYLAREQGWYEDAGLEVEFIEPGDSGSLALVAAGKGDVAVSVSEELIPARVQGLPVRSIAAVVQHNTSSLLSLEEDGITEPADLAGKTYGGFGGQLEQALLDKLVTCGGGDPESLKTVDVGEADYRIGLERNQYDVVWIFDGWDGIRLQQEGVKTNTIPFIDHVDCIPDWYTPILATSTEVEGDRPEDLKAFLAATVKGYQEAMADPAAASEALLSANDDLDPELVKASAEFLSTRYAEDPGAWGQQDQNTWDDFHAFLADSGLIEQPIDVDEAWTNEYLPTP